jgi:predicted small metal-binding protein
MDQKMYQKYCDDAACGFVVKSHDRHEVVSMLKQHAKNVHNIDAAEEEIDKKVEEVDH